MVSQWSSRREEIIKKRSSTLGLEVRVGLGVGIMVRIRIIAFGLWLL
jgi:hypothetical protein